MEGLDGFRRWPENELRLHVTVLMDDEIQGLRSKVRDLETALAAERAARDRAEFHYRCECVVNSQLVDLCRTHRVPFRKTLMERPFDQTVDGGPPGPAGAAGGPP